MPRKKKNPSVIAICVQEPFEDGSSMDLGAISGDDLRIMHQAFITDTITHALQVEDADVRLYYIDDPDRKRFVKIILDYLKKKLNGNLAAAYKQNFEAFEQNKDRWGVRVEHLFDDCFKAGYKNVLIVGSRTPTITPIAMATALRMLKESDAVFGPTPEGRYYVIGMTGSPRIKLSEFDWKSPSIYSEVADAFTEKGLAWSELEIWYAVETPDELEMMVRDINQYRFEGDDLTARETEIAMERMFSKYGG
ncbi:MAG TPA: DUF2064 domain-containing protein [candidate division Zixibacteria bacterium]|nr:DUF2064 domain-containing protein [candidate division Zixibacteria bacterium]